MRRFLARLKSGSIFDWDLNIMQLRYCGILSFFFRFNVQCAGSEPHFWKSSVLFWIFIFFFRLCAWYLEVLDPLPADSFCFCFQKTNDAPMWIWFINLNIFFYESRSAFVRLRREHSITFEIYLSVFILFIIIYVELWRATASL